MTHREYARTTQVPSSWSLAQGLTDASDDRPDAATPIAQPVIVVRRVPLTTITTNVPTPEFPPSQSTRTSMTERERYSPTSYNVIHSRTSPILDELRLQLYARCEHAPHRQRRGKRRADLQVTTEVARRRTRPTSTRALSSFLYTDHRHPRVLESDMPSLLYLDCHHLLPKPLLHVLLNLTPPPLFALLLPTPSPLFPHSPSS